MQTLHTMGIVGTGAMGRGIAQIAAQAGLDVLLFDVNQAAADAARQALAQTWEKLVAKGKMTEQTAQQALQRLRVCSALQEMADAQLVVEAVVEKLQVKRDLFTQLEGIVSTDCILASNTSSLSITAIALPCKQPQRVVGWHFFNPVPLMKVVEVIDGLSSDPAVIEALMALTQRLGHTAVRARDMPGFIVNHAGRGMNIEGLKVAQESIAPFHVIDAIIREQAGFRMGPFELMDLTGLDVSHPVMESIFEQFYGEPRYRPSPITAVRQAGGLLGRKTGAGFYRYVQGKPVLPESASDAAPTPPAQAGLKVWVAPWHEVGHARASNLFTALGAQVQTGTQPPQDALLVLTPFGQDVATLVQHHGLDARRTVALDTLFGLEAGKRRVLMASLGTEAHWRAAAHALLAADGTPVSLINDSPGFVAQRIVANIVNVACDIAQQSIASAGDIDLAVKLGLGYPGGGPLSLGQSLGADLVLEVLHNMLLITGEPRYRASPWLRQRVQLGLPLTTPGSGPL